MNWIRKNEDVRKSALWALISIPISIIFAGGLLHGPPIFEVFYIPALIVMELLEHFVEPQHWLLEVAPPMAQYLGYFLFIYLSLKLLRKLKITEEPGIVKQKSEKDTPGP